MNFLGLVHRKKRDEEEADDIQYSKSFPNFEAQI